MKPIWRRHALAAIWLAACAAFAQADDAPGFRLGGFGTLGANYHSSNDIEYRRSTDQVRGARGGELALGVDSLLGLQLNARANEQFEAVAQVVSRQYSDSTWNPRVTWGFVRYSPDEAVQLRVGRLGLDMQISADSRLIGYSYLPVRPSPEYLGQTLIDTIDGADVTLRHPLGSGLASLKLFYGNLHGRVFSGGLDFKLPTSDGGGAILGYTQGGLQLRLIAGGVKMRDNGDLQPLLDVLRSTGFPSAASAAARLDNRGRRMAFGAIDVAYDNGPLTLQASVFGRRTESGWAIPNAQAEYLLGGYRLSKFTPYVSYAHVKARSRAFSTGLPPFPGLVELDQAALAAVRGNEFNQRSVGIGVRYDVATNFALKLQAERMRAAASPLVQDLGASPRDVKRLTMFSAALDFVF